MEKELPEVAIYTVDSARYIVCTEKRMAIVLLFLIALEFLLGKSTFSKLQLEDAALGSHEFYQVCRSQLTCV